MRGSSGQSRLVGELVRGDKVRVCVFPPAPVPMPVTLIRRVAENGDADTKQLPTYRLPMPVSQ